MNNTTNEMLSKLLNKLREHVYSKTHAEVKVVESSVQKILRAWAYATLEERFQIAEDLDMLNSLLRRDLEEVRAKITANGTAIERRMM